MIADATKNAREAANKFADDSESKLGKIKTASQGQFSIEDRDQYTPYIKKSARSLDDCVLSQGLILSFD